jgi:hypothetical protein
MYKNNFVAVIKCGGKILREQNSEVYLPYGSEYSIWLKNKDARRASVSIEVDGENVLNGHSLIIDGNTSQEIKGFMRDMKETNRFKFIKKTKEIQNHRGDRIDDGLVSITYQFEEPIKPIIWSGSSSGTPWNDGKGFNWQDTHYFYDGNTTGNVRGQTATFACCSNPLPDEGITVKGEKITEQYYNGSIGQLSPETTTIVLQLKGALKTVKPIKKPLTVKTKIKCETCGRKNKSSNKFCYNCGTYLH